MNKKLIVSIATTSLLLIGCADKKDEQKPAPKQEIKKEAPKPKAIETKKEEPKKIEAKVETKAPTTKKSEPKKFDAKHTFNTKCASCHGTDAAKSALGKSKIVSTMSQKDIADALKGYKAGTYGASMKALMSGQVSKFNNTELEALAKYIATLK
jgi:cytochrome c-type protein NapB